MRDRTGNRIEEGHLLYWKHMDAIVKVTRVVDGGIALGGNGEMSPAVLSVELSFPVDVSKLRGEEPQLGDFIRVVDPKQESMLDRAMGGRKQ